MARAGRRPRLRAVTSSSELAGAIADMTPNQLQCRDFGHSWRPYTVEFVPQRKHYLEALRCSRCRTMRVRVLGQRGELLGNRYIYADGYLVQGLGRMESDDRDAMRLASLEHLLTQLGDASKSEGVSA